MAVQSLFTNSLLRLSESISNRTGREKGVFVFLGPLHLAMALGPQPSACNAVTFSRPLPQLCFHGPGPPLLLFYGLDPCYFFMAPAPINLLRT